MLRALVFILLLGLAACSDSSDGINTVPILPWGGFRHDASNSASGPALERNRGNVSLLYSTETFPPGEVTRSTPAVDSDGNVFFGTRNGVVSVDRRGRVRWRATECVTAAGTTEIGSVSSSPTVTPGQNVVFGSDTGQVFALRERNREVECLWAFTPQGGGPLRSSPQVQIDALDLSILGVFIGAAEGRLQAINGSGTPRWSFAAGAPAAGAITSTPAVNITSGGGFLITTPDGLLVAIDAAGRSQWTFPIGVPPFTELQQSPAAAVSVYAVGGSSALFAINPDGGLKWQFLPDAPLPGSPAFTEQVIDDGADIAADTVVYVVDAEGTMYAVRDQDGFPMPIQRCSGDAERSCRMDSCLPDEGTCVSNRCSLSDESCTRDTCAANNVGLCEARPAITPISSAGAVPVVTSPALSADLFLVAGTVDGQICVRAVDGSIPGDDDDPTNPWFDGCVDLGDGGPVRSSPVIGPNGVIHVTTDVGLYIIE